MADFYWPPPSSATITISAIGTTGQTAPTTAIEVAGLDSSLNLQPLQVDASKNLMTNVQASALPSGASTSANQTNGSQKTQVVDGSGNVQPSGDVASRARFEKITDGTNTVSVTASSALKVDGSAVTQPISAASLPLPTGAATAAKQPALGAAGTPSADVITVQGVSSMTALKVDGSGVTQPVSGTVTANAGTGSFTVAQATASNLNATVAQSGTWTVQPGNTANTTAWLTNAQVIPQSGSTNANSSVASTALEASHVIKASAGRLFQLTGVNTSASAQYIQVFNSATVPADTTVPVLLAYVPGGANFSWDFGDIGRYFSTGIAVSNSSTAATKTIGSANCWFNAEYL